MAEDDDLLEEETEGRPVGRPRQRRRDENIAEDKTIRDKLIEIFDDVDAGFTDQNDRANDTLDYWDTYNCKLNGNQFYNGNSQIYVPIIHNAINARKTRFVNQLFPQSGRYVEVTTSDGTIPSAEVALLEDYVRKAKLRTKVLPALVRAGDIEGQYNVYVSWAEVKRVVSMKANLPMEVDTDMDVESDAEGMIEEEIVDGYPQVDVLSDSDVLVLPQTADTLDEAIADGGSVTILRRWSKAKIRALMREGAISEEEGEGLLEAMTSAERDKRDIQRRNLAAAGIQFENGATVCHVYETWTNLKVDGEWRLCQAFYGGESRVLGARRNPLWCDRLPVLSLPVEKVAGVFKGQSKVKFCADMQYAANDAVNEGMDSAAYALLPIIMTDPEKNPRVGSMVLALSAIWETSPADTQFAQFPQLWKEAFAIVGSCRAEVATTFSVNPAALTQQASEKRLTQAEIANEQQIDILTTADAVTVLEDGVLTPILTLMAEMDAQYRDDEVLVRQYGEMGIQANMQRVPPLQMDRRYSFRWFGVESARNAQQIQQQIAGINIIRGIPPEMYPGYQVDLAPAIVQLMENLFGPRLAPLVFKDIKSQLSMDPMIENQLLVQGLDLPIHPMDNDVEHMQAHVQALQMGDPSGTTRAHIEMHNKAMQMKMQAQLMQALQTQLMGQGGAQPGQPPGGPGGPPQSGGPPRMGAQPGMVRNGQAPPGAIHPDNMIDPMRQPQ